VTPRLQPLEPPYDEDTAHTLQRLMPPGVPPLKLFRTIAHNPTILDKFRSTGAYLLNFGTLPERDRELVIQRTCARCGCEYEWGVHAAFYGERVGLTTDQLTATTDKNAAGNETFSAHDARLIELVDQLHDTASVKDETWQALAADYAPAQLVELVVLVGQYHVVSFLANALRVELEEAAMPFPVPGA
jgi:4-carboxymuconolactone decarboxylase